MASIAESTNEQGGTARADDASHAALRLWLYAVAGLILAMVLVGGATRLTNSGLSITEWKPLLGTIPPLSAADWQDAFAKYQQIPEYQIINKGMSLADFKAIYWWEWAHRFLGRFIGAAFFVPFLIFWVRGAIPKGLMPKLAVIFLLGGAQGALGWYMVKSGLVDRTDVSQYRLAAHLGLAVLIYGATLWVAFGLSLRTPAAEPLPGRLKAMAALFVGLVFLQIILGGFVAGTDAGLSHNTWPLMDGAIIPGGLGAMQPWYLNPFENVLTVQFDHRMLAYAIVLLAALNFAGLTATPSLANPTTPTCFNSTVAAARPAVRRAVVVDRDHRQVPKPYASCVLHGFPVASLVELALGLRLAVDELLAQARKGARLLKVVQILALDVLDQRKEELVAIRDASALRRRSSARKPRCSASLRPHSGMSTSRRFLRPRSRPASVVRRANAVSVPSSARLA